MPKITAFVARSFASEDEPKILPIINFLDSFRPLGFVWETAEPAEVESVSEKVRQKIDECDAFVGIFTRRHPIYATREGLRAAFDVLRGRFTPTAWSAPPWVLQESGYALKAGKRLILLRESGVEIPGLQGDLEYIPFDPFSLTTTFQKASEMVNRLVASSAGIAVETVVSAVAQRKDVDAAPSPATTAEAARESGKEGDSFLEMILRIEEHDWQGADEAYQSGLHIAREKGRDEAVHWEALYDFERAITGHPTALDELRALAESNPENPTPLAFLGSCLFDFKQYTEAADCYRSASLLCKSDDATGHLIRAANCLRLAKKLDEARETLINSWNSTPTAKRELRSKILRGLYSVLKDSGDSFQAFAIGEAALHYNPSQSDLRFSLGFDYETAGYFELNVHHFRLICEKDPRNAGALNNLGVAYSNLGLAINSATSYRLALQYESTLAASNLGYRYLNAGMAEDAAEILLEAQKKKDCVPEVTRCLSAVDERRKEEDEKAASALESARKHQDFLVSFGMGYISGVSPALAGDWAFPFGKITLRLGSGRLEGEVMIKVPEPPNVGLGRWLGGLSAPTSDPRVERVQFLGEVCGRTCKYKIIRKDVRVLPPGSGMTLLAAAAALGGHPSSVTEGYIFFGNDGCSDRAAELKDGKPSEYYEIRKEA